MYKNCYLTENIFCRNQNQGFIQALITEQDKIRRRRRATVSIQMTILSWSLEVSAGALAFVLIFFASRYDSLDTFATLLALLHLVLYFIFIPSSYLISTEGWKNIVIVQGWSNLPNSGILSLDDHKDLIIFWAFESFPTLFLIKCYVYSWFWDRFKSDLFCIRNE